MTTTLLVVIACAIAALVPAPPMSAQTAAIDSSKAWDHVRALVDIGPRVAGTPGNARARQYITKTLAGMGITATEQPFTVETPLGRVSMANIVATLPGKRPERIAIGSHFDTKQFRDFRFVGANDGASSTALLLELARALHARPRPFTIDLLFFDGEEAFVEWSPTDGTYGSRHYVDAGRKAGTIASMRAFILLDMVGDRRLAFRREANSTPWLTDLVWAAARRAGHQQHFLADTIAIEDDHLPFLRAGIPSVDLIDLDYEPWHTAADTIDAISARSLQVTGEVVLAALPDIEARLAK